MPPTVTQIVAQDLKSLLSNKDLLQKNEAVERHNEIFRNALTLLSEKKKIVEPVTKRTDDFEEYYMNL